MLHSASGLRLLLVGLVGLGVVIACALPSPGSPEPMDTLPPEAPAETEAPAVVEPPEAEPLVVSLQSGSFNLYGLDGGLRETRLATGVGSYPSPTTAQVVGQSIYYVDGSGSDLGGVVRRVTASESTALDFTQGDEMAALHFAVSPDESRIAWTWETWSGMGVNSQLWIANIDGTNAQMVVQSDPNDDIEEYFALHTVRWTNAGDLIYAWQITGIGGYILFFGWSSFYLYSPASGTSTPLVPLAGEATGPCWYSVSPDVAYAVGGCGLDGMRERELTGGSDTVFPTFPGFSQWGAAAYSPSGARLAYSIAHGDEANEAGQVVVRLSRGEAPVAIANHSPGIFRTIQWIDEERMAVDYSAGEVGTIDLLSLDGTRSVVGDGWLIGLMRP